MRFHVVSLPHTQTTLDYTSCAFTEKVRRFAIMMTNLGHQVFLYSGEENTTPCFEHISCIPKQMRQDSLAGAHYTSGSFDASLPHWKHFNATVIKELAARLEQKDFICLIGGYSQKEIADAFPAHTSVEFGIGYPGTFAKYRVFESYAWMHSIYAQHKLASSVDGNFYDEVIPGYLEPHMFPLQEKKGDYYLFVGRLIERKGYRIAQEVCQRLGQRLIIAGAGPQDGYGEFVGVVGPQQRAELYGGAIATFAPTLYIEPFGNVVIESHMCGTPTITTDWGAFTETNINGLTGYRCRTLAEFMDAAQACKDLDPATIRATAVDKYSLDAIAPRYERYFQRLLGLWDKGWYSERVKNDKERNT
jgi:glycosyltransferase involved in cell wall biosynthesis